MSAALGPGDFVIAFRTHVWDAAVASLAAKLHAASPGAQFVILADETRENLNTAPFPKLSHNDNFTSLGLPNFPHDRVLWYNADYPLYTLRAAFAHARYFAMVEYDVAVNTSLTAIMQAADSNQLDLIIGALQPAPPHWMWGGTAEKFFPRPWQSFLPVIILSARGIDHMLKRRREIWQGQSLNVHEDWPFCETFIPSAIDELGPDNMADLANYADLSRYNLHDALHIHDPAAHSPGSIRHRVYGGPQFAMRQLPHYPIMSVFEPGSELRRRLAPCAPAHFLPVLMRAISNLNDPDIRTRFAELASTQNWSPRPLIWNAAYNKPAIQSSTNAESQFQNPAEDARGGNNGIVSGKHNFHTGLEPEPWWQVDLQMPHHIHQVTLYNRLDLPERARNLSLYLSLNGQDWQLAATKLDHKVFGGADGRPFWWRFSKPATARYVRITLIGEDYLHLDEIEVFGEPA